jgi:hypothetical protein
MTRKFVGIQLSKADTDDIDSRDFILLIVREKTFEDPMLLARLLYIKAEEKPVVIALKEGVNVPMEHFSGITIVAIERWVDGIDSQRACANKLVDAYMKWREELDEQ